MPLAAFAPPTFVMLSFPGSSFPWSNVNFFPCTSRRCLTCGHLESTSSHFWDASRPAVVSAAAAGLFCRARGASFPNCTIASFRISVLTRTHPLWHQPDHPLAYLTHLRITFYEYRWALLLVDSTLVYNLVCHTLLLLPSSVAGRSELSKSASCAVPAGELPVLHPTRSAPAVNTWTRKTRIALSDRLINRE